MTERLQDAKGLGGVGVGAGYLKIRCRILVTAQGDVTVHKISLRLWLVLQQKVKRNPVNTWKAQLISTTPVSIQILYLYIVRVGLPNQNILLQGELHFKSCTTVTQRPARHLVHP